MRVRERERGKKRFWQRKKATAPQPCLRKARWPWPPSAALMSASGSGDQRSGAAQPADDTFPNGAAQPVWAAANTLCVPVRVVSLNVGMPQSMLEADSPWNVRQMFKFIDMLESLGPLTRNDLVFCSEVGDAHRGIRVSDVDYQDIVQEAMPGAACSCSGAYLHIWNVRNRGTAVVETGTWTAAANHAATMHWQAFNIMYHDDDRSANRDAAQLAAAKVGLLVGNMHIPSGGSHPPTITTRRQVVEQALNHLICLRVDGVGWGRRPDFPVVRLLVGDCNLEKYDAEAITHTLRSANLAPVQEALRLNKWQVRDVQLPGPALESARKQDTRHNPKMAFAR